MSKKLVGFGAGEGSGMADVNDSGRFHGLAYCCWLGGGWADVIASKLGTYRRMLVGEVCGR